jgi:hypothetical protein
MNGRFVSDIADVPVPFSRAELIDAYHRGFSLYFVPEGSFVSFPCDIEPVHGPIDVGQEDRVRWLSDVTRASYVLTYPRLYLGTVALPLEAQREVARPFSILSPYELACMGAYGKRLGRGDLFAGQARTEFECGVPSTHLHSNPLTAIAEYDGAGIMRFLRGYTSQVSPNLGVVVGVRRPVA